MTRIDIAPQIAAPRETGPAAVLTMIRYRQYIALMASRTPRASRTREPRVPRTYRLPSSKLRSAQQALGASTATETIERAPDLVVFQQALIRGTKAMLGVPIVSPDAE